MDFVSPLSFIAPASFRPADSFSVAVTQRFLTEPDSWTVLFEHSPSGDEGEYTLERMQADFFNETGGLTKNSGTTLLVGEGGNRYLSLVAKAGQVGADGGVEIFDRLEARADFALRYKFRFPEGFEFVLGGKLPGIRSDTPAAPGTGMDPDEPNRFSVRPMWREAGRMVMYVYHADMPGAYGEDFPLVWPWTGGRAIGSDDVWYEMVVRVRMNSAGQADGLLAVYARPEGDGSLLPVLYVPTMRYWEPASEWYGTEVVDINFFFGGNTAEWAPSTDQSLHVRDIAYLSP